MVIAGFVLQVNLSSGVEDEVEGVTRQRGAYSGMPRSIERVELKVLPWYFEYTCGV